MILYQVMEATPSSIQQLAEVATRDDAVLLLGDALYRLHDWHGPAPLYARESDLKQRGLPDTAVALISDQQWIEMTLTHNKVMTWR